MNQLLSTLRLSAILFAMIGAAAAHATTPGTITPEQDDTVQQEQDGNDDGFLEEDDQNNQDEYPGYGQEQDQDDNWGDDQDQGKDQGKNQGKDQGKNQGKGQDDRRQDDKNGRGQDDGYDRGQDDGYDRPGKPGRDQGKPGYDRRPRRLVETVNVYQQYFGGARLPLNMMVNNLRRFQGYRLATVVINGSSEAGMGMAVFCSSQCSQMQNVGYYRTAYPIRTLGERINPRSSQWFLELRGNFWIESIQLEFVR